MNRCLCCRTRTDGPKSNLKCHLHYLTAGVVTQPADMPALVSNAPIDCCHPGSAGWRSPPVSPSVQYLCGPSSHEGTPVSHTPGEGCVFLIFSQGTVVDIFGRAGEDVSDFLLIPDVLSFIGMKILWPSFTHSVAVIVLII